ncbi:MAG: DUF2851 family protein [Candidatus Altiarchaeota archaeon]
MEIMSPEKLSELGEKWLETKIQRMKNLLKIAEPDEALYREIMLSLGYPKNKVQFLELALILPYREVKKLKQKHIIEKVLLYRAGFINEKNGLPNNFDFSLKMHKSVWVHKNIRPNNYPEKRIKGICNVLFESIHMGLVNFFMENIKFQIMNANPTSALRKIMNFPGIGLQRKEEMFFNIILPFILAYSLDEDIKKFLYFMFANYPPLKPNALINKFLKYHPNIQIKTAKEYMGAIFLIKSSDKYKNIMYVKSETAPYTTQELKKLILGT